MVIFYDRTTRDDNTTQSCSNKRSKTIDRYLWIIFYVDIIIHSKQLRLSSMKTKVSAFFTESANSLTAKMFAFTGGSNVKKPSPDEHHKANKICVEYALKFIVEVLYKSITKVPGEVGYITQPTAPRLTFHFHVVVLAIVYSEKSR